MSKLEVDTTKMVGEILPSANTALSKINNAKSYSSKVSLPDGDYNWSSVNSKIVDYAAKTDKYCKWLDRISTDYGNTITGSVENISGLEIGQVSKFV